MCVCLVAVSRREPSLSFIARSLRGNIPFFPYVPKGMIPSTVSRSTCWDAQVCERFSKACIKGNEGEVKELTNKKFEDICSLMSFRKTTLYHPFCYPLIYRRLAYPALYSVLSVLCIFFSRSALLKILLYGTCAYYLELTN